MTQKELAKKLKVSQKTISRVLNGEGSVQTATRKKILAAMDRYNYQPNTNASNLVSGRKGNVGILFHAGLFANSPFFTGVLPHINTQLLVRNYNSTLYPVETAKDIDATLANAAPRVDGFVIFESGKLHEFVDILERKLIDGNCNKCVKLHSGQASGLFPAIGIDDFNAGYTATEHLIKSGCKKLVYWGTKNTGQKENIERRGGFVKACEKHTLAHEIIQSETHEIREIIANKKNAFDGVFAWSDLWGRTIAYELQILGRKIPQDVKIIGFDNDKKFTLMAHPYLSSVEQDHAQLALEAIKILFSEVDNELGINIKTKLIIRESSS